MFWVIVFLASAVLGQEICTATSVGVQGGVDTIDKLQPQRVIYVNIIGPYYGSSMKTGYNMLRHVLARNYPGSTVDYMTCTPAGCDTNWAQYTQIWVADLSSIADDHPVQMQGYKKMANWYIQKDKPHLIADGRLLSSFWPTPGCCAEYDFVYPGTGRPNPRLMENYFVSLALRGGGMMLGTDHDVFTFGINEILVGSGFQTFTGYYYSQPLILEIDARSPVLSFPLDASEFIPGHTVPGRKFLWDDSSTAFSPISEQPNGLILFPIGWHGQRLQDAFRPGISTTIRGSTGFLIDIRTPKCGQIFAEGSTIRMEAIVVQDGNLPYKWTWTSSLDGVVGSSQVVEKALTPGRHLLTVRVQDQQRFVATAWVTITLIGNSGQAECFVYSRNETEVVEYFPLARVANAPAWYSYGSPKPQRANTGDKIEDQVPLSSNVALYNDGKALSMVVVQSQNPLTATFKVSAGLTLGKGKVDWEKDLDPVAVTLRDDPNDVGFVYNKATGAGTVTWTYQASTKGFILGNLPNKAGDRWCLTVTYDNAASKGVNWIDVFGHNKFSKDVPNANKVGIYQYASPLTKTVSFCRAQCGCPVQDPRTTLVGYIEPVMWTQGNPGNFMKKYNDAFPCTWVIAPTSTNTPVKSIAVRMVGDFGIANGDSLNLKKSADGAASSDVWTATGTAPPPAQIVKGNKLDVIFNTNKDGVGGPGWTLMWMVVPETDLLTPDIGSIVDKTTSTVTGSFFLNSPSLAARLVFPDGRTTPIDITFVNQGELKVVIPPNPVGTAIVQITNDGQFWSDKNLTFEWFDPSCDNITTCAGCAAKASSKCSWCNDLANPGKSFCFSDVKKQCPADPVAFKVDTACCTVCGPLNKCNGGGKCLCNETCECDMFHWADDCKCMKCPVGEKPAAPAVVPPNFNCSGRGVCGCDGNCTCNRGFRGVACECRVCEGEPSICSGHGECQCDGSCKCNAGWKHAIEARPVCDCSTECPGANNVTCSGHGTCNCGVCQCEGNWGKLPDCSCIDACPQECNERQTCTCNGTCACLPGWYGPNCTEKVNCSIYKDCVSCMNNSRDCGWCDDAGVCENFLTATFCGEDEFLNPRGFLFATQCELESLEVKDVESDNRSSLLIAALVGTILCAAIALFAAAALLQAAPLVPPDFAPFQAGGGAAYIESPIYVGGATGGSA